MFTKRRQLRQFNYAKIKCTILRPPMIPMQSGSTVMLYMSLVSINILVIFQICSGGPDYKLIQIKMVIILKYIYTESKWPSLSHKLQFIGNWTHNRQRTVKYMSFTGNCFNQSCTFCRFRFSPWDQEKHEEARKQLFQPKVTKDLNLSSLIFF